ncbi:hypothetical protein [Shewanella sp. Isolate11]|uniref:hypothetical protein n=1 Tax=Shewanella sp. Isolate11 TaxID=2908530 RepID=UPI001EFEC626|nr:hypothetical protein [Shewanella sp. Isolate11]MCG9697237.1 hypothetical protein [Shewanella sp. Isolate11]
MVGFGDIEAFFALKERYEKWRKPEPVVTNTAQRFIRLFEGHGVARAQIPRFFGHNLTIHQVEDEAELLKALDEEILEAAAALFGVRVEWLEGCDEDIYDINLFNKAPKAFGDWLDELKIANNFDTDGWLVITQRETYDYDGLIIIREQLGMLRDKPIYRYHFCDLWMFNYWKCRADLAACVAQSLKRGVFISGREISEKRFAKLSTLQFFPNSEKEHTSVSGKRFAAEDLTINPEFFVRGLLDGQLGIDCAINRWLEYHEQDLMDSGFGDHWQVFNDFVHLNSNA